MSKRLLILPLLVLILLSLVIPYYPVSAQGWLSGWKYRIPITISNSGGALSNYQIQITVNTASLISAGKMRSDCGDIRFTDSDGTTLINYWVNPVDINSQYTRIFIKVPSIPSGSKTIYMYYGNPSATSQSNADNVFELFDWFYYDNGVINTNKWGVWTYSDTSSSSITLSSNSWLKMSFSLASSGVAGASLIAKNALSSGSYDLHAEIKINPPSVSPSFTTSVYAGFTNSSSPSSYPSNFYYQVPIYKAAGGVSLSSSNAETIGVFYGSSSSTTSTGYSGNANVIYLIDVYLLNGNVQAKIIRYNQGTVDYTQTLTGGSFSPPSLYPFLSLLGVADSSALGSNYALYGIIYVKKYASPEPSYSLGSEQAPPTLKPYNLAFTYSYGGSYQVYADACYVSSITFNSQSYDSYTQINSSCNRYYKTFSNLAAGSYTISISASGPAGSTSGSATLTINKANPSLSLSITNNTWVNGASVSASETNKGDNDVQYTVYLCDSSGYCTTLGGPNTYSVKDRPSGIYTVKFTSSGGQNWTSSSITKTLELKQAWEKTDSIYANQSYRYDYDKSAIPIKAYYKFRPANTTVYVNGYLYIYSSSINVTNNDTILHQTFTNVIVNDSIPSGFISVNASSFSVSSLSFGQSYAPQRKVYAKSVCAYEKARLLNVGHAVYTISVNSSFVKDLPVVYVLPEPPNWSQRISYSITVDNKTSGFSFDPDTLTLNISTSFSQSSLEVGDHTVDLTYSLATPDLTVKSIKTGSLIEGQETTVNVTIANVGGADVTQQFKVYLYANSSAVGSTTVASLAAHAETLVSFKWTPSSAGSYTLQAVVDPDNVIKEANEANNQLSTTVVVAEATSSNATSGGAPSGGTSGGAPSQPSGGAPSGGTSGGISLPSLPSAIPSGPAFGIPIPILLAIPVIFIILMLLLRRRSKRKATWLKK